MCWDRDYTLDPDDASPRVARHQAEQDLSAMLAAAGAMVVFDAGLVISELATNALTAGATEVTLQITVHYDELSISMTDNAHGLPGRQPLSVVSEHGRGMRIVEALASRWGAEMLTEDRKRVWAHLPVHPDVTRRLACSRR